jgi:hypothetical protein
MNTFGSLAYLIGFLATAPVLASSDTYEKLLHSGLLGNVTSICGYYLSVQSPLGRIPGETFVKNNAADQAGNHSFTMTLRFAAEKPTKLEILGNQAPDGALTVTKTSVSHYEELAPDEVSLQFMAQATLRKVTGIRGAALSALAAKTLVVHVADAGALAAARGLLTAESPDRFYDWLVVFEETGGGLATH